MQAFESTGNSAVVTTANAQNVTDEDILRAQIYRLLAGFLSKPPSRSDLKTASAFIGDDSEFGAAINSFAKIAGQCTPDNADTEYHDLFIGVARGELLPFGSYYQAGFLNEKPLAKLRAYMASNGIEPVSDFKEPEDHIASVLEIMAGIIEGTYGVPLSLSKQKDFFDEHINSWASHFFQDLEKARHSFLFAPLGTIGRLFMQIEQDGFEMI